MSMLGSGFYVSTGQVRASDKITITTTSSPPQTVFNVTATGCMLPLTGTNGYILCDTYGNLSTVPAATGVVNLAQYDTIVGNSSNYATQTTDLQINSTNIVCNKSITGTNAFFTTITGSKLYLGSSTPITYFELTNPLIITISGPFAASITGTAIFTKIGNAVSFAISPGTTGVAISSNDMIITGVPTRFLPSATSFENMLLYNNNLIVHGIVEIAPPWGPVTIQTTGTSFSGVCGIPPTVRNWATI